MGIVELACALHLDIRWQSVLAVFFRTCFKLLNGDVQLGPIVPMRRSFILVLSISLLSCFVSSTEILSNMAKFRIIV